MSSSIYRVSGCHGTIDVRAHSMPEAVEVWARHYVREPDEMTVTVCDVHSADPLREHDYRVRFSAITRLYAECTTTWLPEGHKSVEQFAFAPAAPSAGSRIECIDGIWRLVL